MKAVKLEITRHGQPVERETGVEGVGWGGGWRGANFQL